MAKNIQPQSTKRKALSKKLRFEVFKRDNFTCQYCGSKAPDVVLNVDHINPVASGGGNDILNLVTSCEGCNSGKGARELGDHSVLAQQRKQLEELGERREQLEMMVNWREGLTELSDQEVSAFEQAFRAATGQSFSDFGRAKAAKTIKKYGLAEVLEALDASVETYLDLSLDGDDANENVGVVFARIPAIIAAKKRNADKPYMRDLYYARACVRNRVYCNESWALELLEQAYHAGVHVEDLKDWAKTARSWTAWREQMEAWIEEAE